MKSLPSCWKNVHNFTSDDSLVILPKGKQDHTESIAENCHTCKVTGLDISMQKETSRFLCTGGIRYYIKNHPAIWEQLRERLSKRWQKETLDVQIREIHHSIRNQYFNTRRDVSRIYSRPMLFDTTPYIDPQKRDLINLSGDTAMAAGNQIHAVNSTI